MSTTAPVNLFFDLFLNDNTGYFGPALGIGVDAKGKPELVVHTAKNEDYYPKSDGDTSIRVVRLLSEITNLSSRKNMLAVDAAVNLSNLLADDPNVQTVGVTEGAPVIELIVYTFKKPKDVYPKSFEGYPVRAVKFGKFSPLGSK
jgi:hypothetical protein